MMDTKHTPGPWYAGLYDTSPNFLRVGKHMAVGREGDDMLIAVCGTPGFATSEADARLIAAAPDLLAACKAMLELTETDHGDSEETDAAFDLARAAIAKAESEAA